MRLSILILSIVLPAAAAASPPRQTADPLARCPSDRVTFADRQAKAPSARRLGELPPGQLYLTVDREVNGCRQPVIVRYGIGQTRLRPGR